MIKISICEDVISERFIELISFISKRSNSISVSRYYTDFLNESEFIQMQKEYKEYIYKEDAERREKYKNNRNNYQFRLNDIFHFNNEHDAFSYFDELFNQELAMFEELQYSNFSEKPDNRFTSKSDEFIKTMYTRVTPVTTNPVFEMCYFRIGQVYSSIITNMKGLYDFPYIIDGIEYEDITFYENDNIVLAVCSHERNAYLNLHERDFETFKELEITYEIMSQAG